MNRLRLNSLNFENKHFWKIPRIPKYKVFNTGQDYFEEQDDLTEAIGPFLMDAAEATESEG